MEARSAWVLNLDADLELGAGADYRPTKGVQLAMKTHAESLAVSLLGPDDVLVEPSTPALFARGLRGRAFCPTPRALRMLRHAGAMAEPHPSVAVLRRVNSRAFATSLGPTLPGGAFVTDFAAASAILRSEPPVGDAWRVKYAFGMAGRNQRVVRLGPVSPVDEAYVKTGLAAGGLQIEPNVSVAEEYALHGILEQDGSLRIGALVRQRCSPRGVWIASEPAVFPASLQSDLPRRLQEEVCRVAVALAQAGFFGPFGVDAYTYRDRAGTMRLQPRSEINARYTMGFAVGFPGGASEASPWHGGKK